jgi:hypothetical protein
LDHENESNQKFHSYTALCPRSQNYSRDMSNVMDSLQKVRGVRARSARISLLSLAHLEHSHV